MSEIKLIPYQRTENQKLGEVDLTLFNTEFGLVAYHDGEVTCYFFNCYYNRMSIKNYEQIEGYPKILIHFFGCCIDNLDVDEITTNNIHLSFDQCIVAGRVSSNTIASVELTNCLLKYSFFFIRQIQVLVKYNTSEILPRVWHSFLDNLNLSNFSNFLAHTQNLHFHDCKSTVLKMVLESDRDKAKFIVDKYILNDLFKIRYKLGQKDIAQFKVHVNIDFRGEYDKTNVSIVGADLDSLQMEGVSNGKFTIENTKIDTWYIRNFSSADDVIFYNIKPRQKNNKDSLIELHKSNLDKFWFDNVNFNDFGLVSFYRTRIGKVIFTSCNFPDEYASFEKFQTLQNANYKNVKPENFFKDQYETFLQLKSSLDSTGNTYESLRFQAYANDMLRKFTKLSKWDKVLLLMNSQSNNHGVSIERPFWLFWAGGGIFYFLYLVSLGYIFNNKDFDFSLWGSFFTFLDITHKIDFLVEKEKLTGWSQFFDFAGKTYIGYIVFQFIAAFRKYGKSK